MDVILNSNASSALVSVLKSLNTEKNGFDYKFAQSTEGMSMSALSRTFQELQPQNTASFGQAVDIPISKAGLLKQMFLKVKVTNSSGATINLGHAHGVSVIDRIQLITSGRILAEQTAESLLCQISSQPKNSRNCLAKLANILDVTGQVALTDGSTRKSYIPIMFSQFEALEKVYDTNFTSNLVLRCYISAASANASAALSSVSVSAYAEYIREPADMQQQRVQSSFGDGALQRLQWNTHQEQATKTLSAADRKMELEIKTNNVIQEMWIYAQDNSTHQTNFKGVVLDAVKIEANGQVIADFGNSEDGELLLHISDMDADKWQFAHGNGYDTGSDALVNRYKYNFGLTTDTRKVMGVAAARELSNFKVNVEVAGATETAHTLFVVYKYLQIESIDAASGKVTTSISS